jgi:hypothetical protein
MARPAYGGRATCEGCKSIDVRRWHREGRLHAGQFFSWAWTRHGEPSGSIDVRVGSDDALFVKHGSRPPEWQPREQCLLISWTPCHFGGRRPWLICSGLAGRYCGRRVAVLYASGQLFACRRCHGLAYASQQESPMDRALSQAQKLRLRLGGSPCTFDCFPNKPPRMHWRTYRRLAARAERVEGTLHDLASKRFSVIIPGQNRRL